MAKTLWQRIEAKRRLSTDWLLGELQNMAGMPQTRVGSSAQALREWLGHLKNPPAPKGRMLISALRNETWIEWAAYCACHVRRLGYESTLLYSSSLNDSLCKRKRLSRRFFDSLRLIPGLELVDIDQASQAPDDTPAFLAHVKKAVPAALAYDHGLESEDIIDNPARFEGEVEQMTACMLKAGRFLRSLLATRRFHRFILYSGIIAESAALLYESRAAGLPVICLEAWGWRPGHMVYNLDAPALEYNIQGWLAALGPWDAVKEREINTYFKFLDGKQFGDEKWLKNFNNIQRAEVGHSLPEDLRRFLEGDKPVFLLATNVIGDSSMILRETIFNGEKSWVAEMIKYFSQRDDCKLLIRAHPAEVWMGMKVKVKMGEFARSHLGNAKNVFVLDGTAKVNTFSLIPFARAGLAWLSSVGVDMVVRGLPVVCAARPKYEGLGIVEEPATRAEYFKTIERWIHTEERPTAQQIIQGKRYLHLTFKQFSFPGSAPNYRAWGFRMDRMPEQVEHDRFYRILVGQEPMPELEALKRASA